MNWHELTIYTSEEATDAIAAGLNIWGADGVSIEESWQKHEGKQTPLGGWYEVPDNDIPIGEAVIKAYFPNSKTPESLREIAEQLLEQVKQSGLDAGIGKITVGTVNEEDWANSWKKYYHPVKVTERLTVKPTWEAYEPEEGEIIIELDPGMAFGTGTHETTTLCMKLLEKYVSPESRVIDVGTGSGILSVVSSKLGASQVVAVDLDPVAVSSAKENVRINGLESKVEVLESDLLGVFHNKEMQHVLPADLVVANILADIILRLLGDAHQVLKKGGMFIASGIIESKRAEVEKALTDYGFSIEETLKDKDWVAIVAVKQ